MKMYLKHFCCFWSIFLLFSCFKETPVKVSADFEIEVINNDYSVPVTIRIINKTAGADLYAWSFDGGCPGNSGKFCPDEITYDTPGTYLIRLEAWNSTERQVKELTIELDSALHAIFSWEVLVNNFSPAEVKWINNSRGGSRYYWEFEGGEPASSDWQYPPQVTFQEAGIHVVRLQVFNSREVTTYTDTIRVFPALSVNFNWEAEPDDNDLQVPLTVRLSATCTSALSYFWKAEGGRIDNDTLAETRVYFDRPGNYSVELFAGNGKETKSAVRQIDVLENTNLYVVRNLKFGVTTALNTIGGYYSSSSRSVLTSGELTVENGPGVDVVFWGLPDGEQCCFISPDSAAFKALPDIPRAGHSWLMNRPDIITPAQFEGIHNDEWLKSLPIQENSDPDLYSYFSEKQLPHVVLFETGDHRKGAILVKEFVKAAKESYIVADIKVQKKKN